jgi:hypothetical protein
MATDEATLRDENQRLRDALEWWQKFAWYASGDSGNTPLEMNLWQATLFSHAYEATKVALGAVGDDGREG